MVRCELVDVAVDGIVVGSGSAEQVEEVVDVDWTAIAASGIEVAVTVVENDGGLGRIFVGNFPTPGRGLVI